MKADKTSEFFFEYRPVYIIAIRVGTVQDNNGDSVLCAGFHNVIAGIIQVNTVIFTQALAQFGGDDHITAVAEGFAVFEETLRGQSLSVSGVNIDEEVIRMISFQRAYQATARYISTVSSMLETLINL